MPWQLYILQSELTGTFYVGISQNLCQRLEFHNLIGHGFTARYRPWKLVYSKEYSTRRLAQTAEKKIKARKSNEFIRRIIDHSIVL
ncbi:MAG: GIY-YIG nuclease family protein [Bacteroidota bacterium]